MAPLPISARVGDPVLDTIARSIYALFPRCMRCGERIERFEDAEVMILTSRVAHRKCPGAGD